MEAHRYGGHGGSSRFGGPNTPRLELRDREFGLFDGIPDEALLRLFPPEYEHYPKDYEY